MLRAGPGAVPLLSALTAAPSSPAALAAERGCGTGGLYYRANESSVPTSAAEAA